MADLSDLIRAHVCVKVITSAWAAVDRGERLDVVLEKVEKAMPDLIDKARAQVGLAELLARESTPAAVRAAATKLDDAARARRGEGVLSSGIVLKTADPYIDRLTARAQAHRLGVEIEQLRKSKAAAEEDLKHARIALASRSAGATPGDVLKLEGDVQACEGIAGAAHDNLRRAEEQLAKLAR